MNIFTKRTILSIALIFLINIISAQLGLELRPGYNDSICPGFDREENVIIIDVVNNPPLPPASNSLVEYYWIIDHEQGNWAYQTNSSARAFQTSFQGEYTIRCQVLYIDITSAQAYASFWSSPLIVNTGENCE